MLEWEKYSGEISQFVPSSLSCVVAVVLILDGNSEHPNIEWLVHKSTAIFINQCVRMIIITNKGTASNSEIKSRI